MYLNAALSEKLLGRLYSENETLAKEVLKLEAQIELKSSGTQNVLSEKHESNSAINGTNSGNEPGRMEALILENQQVID